MFQLIACGVSLFVLVISHLLMAVYTSYDEDALSQSSSFLYVKMLSLGFLAKPC